jgi:hypothetical protein
LHTPLSQTKVLSKLSLPVAGRFTRDTAEIVQAQMQSTSTLVVCMIHTTPPYCSSLLPTTQPSASQTSLFCFVCVVGCRGGKLLTRVMKTWRETEKRRLHARVAYHLCCSAGTRVQVLHTEFSALLLHLGISFH